MRHPLTSARALRLLAVCSVPVLIVALAAAGTASAAVSRIDSALADEAVAAPSGPVAEVTRGVTALGSTEVTLMIVAFALALLATVRHWRGLFAVALAFAATEATVFAAKLLVARPRPSEAIVEVSSFSFPSGHAATAVALYVLLACLAARACTGLARVALFAAGGLVALGVGVSRVILGVHYPSDVIAGWLIGGALALAAWLAADWVRDREWRSGRATPSPS